jgi:hypothetical protein
VATEITAGSTERTSGYFGDQILSESKSPVSRPAFGFIIFSAPNFRNPYMTKVTNQLGSTSYLLLTAIATPFDISSTFEIVSGCHHNFKWLNLDFR